MNICVAGKNNIAVEICQYLTQYYPMYPIKIIPNRNDKGIDGFQRSFLKYAQENGIEITTLEKVYIDSDLLFLSLEFDRIINPSLFVSRRLFNIHFSMLPAYKGMFTSAFPILNGEKQTGVTLHYIDSGIDTGDIIAQSVIEINPTDTAKDLYLKYIEQGTLLVKNHLQYLIENSVKAYRQPKEESTYYSKSSIDYSNLCLNFHSTAYQLSLQVRAFHFRDYQLPKMLGIPIIKAVILDTKSEAKPGTVLFENRDKITVATIDYDIDLYKDCMGLVLDCCEQNRLDELKEIPFITYYVCEKELVHGWTPLMVAAYNNSIDVFCYLMENGAQINVQNNNGTTVFMYAKDAALRNKDYSIIDLCLHFKADPYIRDYSSKDLFDYLQDQSVDLADYIKKNIS